MNLAASVMCLYEERKRSELSLCDVRVQLSANQEGCSHQTPNLQEALILDFLVPEL